MIPAPFGGFAILLAISIALFIGLGMIVFGRRSRRHILTGLGVIVLPGVLLGAMTLQRPGIDEWNPTISNDTEVWGNWEGDGYLIALHPDATFSARLKDQSIRGAWKRDDWNLYLSSMDQQRFIMRFARDAGKLLILPHPPDDPDEGPGPIAKKR